MLLAQMPLSSIWFIGFAIGVDLIFDGASLVGFGTAIYQIFPKQFGLRCRLAIWNG
jgi:uncharacterized membrane protein HdeD (DUF308 family)